jgi:hypothetical protein
MIAWTHAEDRLLWHLAEEETSWREKANLFVDRSHKSLKQRWGRIRDLPPPLAIAPADGAAAADAYVGTLTTPTPTQAQELLPDAHQVAAAVCSYLGAASAREAAACTAAAQPQPSQVDSTARDDCPLSPEDVASLPSNDRLPRSFLRDGRAWEALAPNETLCAVRAADRRGQQEDWRVHDGRALQEAQKPPKPETKPNWPREAFSVPYMTTAGPRRFCISTGEWGSSAKQGGMFYSPAQATKYMASTHVATVEQARRKDKAYQKAQLKAEYQFRQGPLSDTTGTTCSEISLEEHFSDSSGSSKDGGNTGGNGGSRGTHGRDMLLRLRSQGKRQRTSGGDTGGGSASTSSKSCKLRSKSCTSRKLPAGTYLQTTHLEDMFEAQDKEGNWCLAVTRGDSNVIHYVGWPRSWEEEFTPAQMKQRRRARTGEMLETPYWEDRTKPYQIIISDSEVNHEGAATAAGTSDTEYHRDQSPQGCEQGSGEGSSALAEWEHVARGGNHDFDKISFTGHEALKKTHRRNKELLAIEYFKKRPTATYDKSGKLQVDGDVQEIDYVFPGAHSLGL